MVIISYRSKFTLIFIYCYNTSLYVRLKTTGQRHLWIVTQPTWQRESISACAVQWSLALRDNTATFFLFFSFRRETSKWQRATLNGLDGQSVSREDERPSFSSKTARRWLVDEAGVPKKDIISHWGLNWGGERARRSSTPPALHAFRLSYNAACFHRGLLGTQLTHSDFMYSAPPAWNLQRPVID